MDGLSVEFVERYATAPRHEKIQICRNPTLAEKFQLGPLLFDRECEIIKKEILRQFPDASDMFVMDALRLAIRMIHDERLKVVRRSLESLT